MKKDVANKEDKFLYPGDVMSGFLGEDYPDDVLNFLKKSIDKARFKDMKYIYKKLHTFLEWKPKGSPIAYEHILEDVVHHHEANLSYVCGTPFLEGKKNKMEVTRICGHEEHDLLEGYIGLSFIPDIEDLMAYNPLFALQRPALYHIQPDKKGKYKANVCVSALALYIKKTTRKIKNADANQQSALFSTDIQDLYVYVSNIYSVQKFVFNETEYYQLEIELLQDKKNNKSLRIYLYVNKGLLGRYRPKVNDYIYGSMQLYAYLDEKDCKKNLKTTIKEDECIKHPLKSWLSKCLETFKTLMKK